MNISADASKSIEGNLSVACLICEEPIVLTEMEKSRLMYGLDIDSKVCDNCKNAILYYRRKFESREDWLWKS